MGDAFVSQPEFFEAEIGESLIARTETLATFRELGPPDLCQVVKTTDSSGRSSTKDVCMLPPSSVFMHSCANR